MNISMALKAKEPNHQIPVEEDVKIKYKIIALTERKDMRELISGVLNAHLDFNSKKYSYLKELSPKQENNVICNFSLEDNEKKDIKNI